MSKAVCVLMRNGVEIWVTEDVADNILKGAERGGKFFKIEDETINLADMTGIYSSQTMQERSKHKRGLWKSKGGDWYTRRENPFMDSYAPKEIDMKNKKAITDSPVKLMEGIKS